MKEFVDDMKKQSDIQDSKCKVYETELSKMQEQNYQLQQEIEERKKFINEVHKNFILA